MKGLRSMRALASALLALLLIPMLQGCLRHAALPPATVHGQPSEEPPPGLVAVDVVSDDEDQVWNVYSGGNVVCTTPCTQWFRARESLLLESNDGDRLHVRGFGVQALQSRRAMLVAEGSCSGKYVNGIVFTTFGGMGLVTAITLAAVGCSDLEERRGMCNAGLITGGISLPVTAFALWMLLDSHPKAHILPIFKTHARNGQPPVTFAVAPNGVAGTF
jgi:hypothetical protein